MFRQQFFTSEILNIQQYNFVLEMLSSDVSTRKNVFLYWKKGSWKTKIVDILASLSQREIEVISNRYLTYGNKEMFESFNQINTAEIFWRENAKKGIKEKEENWETKSRNLRALSWIKDVNVNNKGEQWEKTNESQNSFDYSFKKEELEGLFEPYLSIYQSYREDFKDIFFIAIKLDAIKDKELSLDRIFKSLYWITKLLPYKNKWVFIIDNFGWFDGSYERVLLGQIEEYNAHGIQFIFVSDDITPNVKNNKKLLCKEVNNEEFWEIISSEIIDDFAKWKTPFQLWLNKNKKQVFQCVKKLKEEWRMEELGEPWNTETFILNLQQKYSENNFDKIKKSIERISLEKISKDWNIDIEEFVDEKYWAKNTQKKYLDTKELATKYSDIVSQVIWQNQPVKQLLKGVATSILLNATPKWVYLLLWPTGVWKTETSKLISEKLYWKNKIHIIKCDQLDNPTKLSSLQGSQAWYVGYGEWETLADITTMMWEWVIVFDEIEKADKEVIKTFITAIEDWKMMMGRTWAYADLSKFTLIFTSNAITDIDEVLHSKSSKSRSMRTTKSKEELTPTEIKALCINYLTEETNWKFKPEFLGRFNDIIIFNKLSEQDYVTILKQEQNRLKEKYTAIYNKDSMVSLEDILQTIELSPTEKINLIEETIKTNLWARYLIKKVQEVVNEHQDKLFDFQGQSEKDNAQTLQEFKDEYEQYLKEKQALHGVKDTRLFTLDKLNKFYEDITSELYGQDETIAQLLTAMYSNFATNKTPKWVYLFLWPTGVWKTETARQIAKKVFWNENKLHIVPMNEYTSDIDLNKLKGVAAWYVWHWDNSIKTLKDIVDWMWGSGVLVFDEVEKASYSIIQALLVALETGKMEMESPWIYADLSNFVIIFTTNAITDMEKAIKEFKENREMNLMEERKIWFVTIQYKKDKQEKKEESVELFDENTYEGKLNIMMEYLKKAINPATRMPYFSPEFLWRIDNIFFYRGFYKKEDTDIYFKVIESWVNKQIDIIEKTHNPDTTDLSLEQKIEFLKPTKEEATLIIQQTKTNKLGFRNVIKQLENLKNKKLKEFIGLGIKNKKD